MFDFLQMLKQTGPMQGIMGALGNPQGAALDQSLIPGDQEWNDAQKKLTQQALASVAPPGSTQDTMRTAMDLPGGSVGGGTMTQSGAEKRNKMGMGLMNMGQMLQKPQMAPQPFQMPAQMQQFPQMPTRNPIPMPYSPFARPTYGVRG